MPEPWRRPCSSHVSRVWPEGGALAVRRDFCEGLVDAADCAHSTAPVASSLMAWTQKASVPSATATLRTSKGCLAPSGWTWRPVPPPIGARIHAALELPLGAVEFGPEQRGLARCRLVGDGRIGARLLRVGGDGHAVVCKGRAAIGLDMLCKHLDLRVNAVPGEYGASAPIEHEARDETEPAEPPMAVGRERNLGLHLRSIGDVGDGGVFFRVGTPLAPGAGRQPQRQRGGHPRAQAALRGQWVPQPQKTRCLPVCHKEVAGF